MLEGEVLDSPDPPPPEDVEAEDAEVVEIPDSGTQDEPSDPEEIEVPEIESEPEPELAPKDELAGLTDDKPPARAKQDTLFSSRPKETPLTRFIFRKPNPNETVQPNALSDYEGPKVFSGWQRQELAAAIIIEPRIDLHPTLKAIVLGLSRGVDAEKIAVSMGKSPEFIDEALSRLGTIYGTYLDERAATREANRLGDYN